MPDISIIVPVYNVEAYIPKCLQSILKQSFEDFELILVDDGSSDSCGAICDSYAEKDKRIKVIHQKNQGVSAARNNGIDIAQGKYITFVDSDDYLEPKTLEILLDGFSNNMVSMSICNRIWESDTGEIIDRPKDSHMDLTEYLTTKNAMRVYLNGDFFGTAPWGKMYKAELFKSIRFPIGKLAEDRAILYKLIHQCPFVFFTHAPLYHYIKREASFVSSKSQKLDEDELFFWNELCDFITSHYPEIKKNAYASRCNTAAAKYLSAPYNNQQVLSSMRLCVLKSMQYSLLSKHTSYKLKIMVVAVAAFGKITRVLYQRRKKCL